MINITIELDETMLHDSAKAAWQKLLRAPEYSSGNGGEGHQHIQRQVLESLKAMDLSAVIAASVTKQLASTVDDVVAQMLRDAVKKQAKAMQARGDLLQAPDLPQPVQHPDQR